MLSYLLVGITIQNASAGDYFVLSKLLEQALILRLKNGTTFVDKQFTFQAVGYGKGCNMEESIF